MKIQQDDIDIQAVTRLYPKSFENPVATTLKPMTASPSSFHSSISTLTAAAHRAVSDLFPELVGNNSCFEMQRKFYFGTASKAKNLTASKSCSITRPIAPFHPYKSDRIAMNSSRRTRPPHQEEPKTEYFSPTGLSELREGEATPRRVKREISFDSPTAFFTLPPVLPTMPTHPCKVELPRLSSDLVNLGLKQVWLLEQKHLLTTTALTYNSSAGLFEFY